MKSTIQLPQATLSILLVGFLTCLGCNKQTPTASPTASVEKPASEEKKPVPQNQPDTAAQLSISDLKIMTTSNGKLVVHGATNNASGKKYSRVDLEINLFDKEGASLGTTAAGVDNLEAGFTWSFDAEITQRTAVSAKVTNITAK